MFKTISLILCLLSFWLAQLACDQLVTTVPSTVIPLTVTVSLFASAADKFVTNDCDGSFISLNFVQKQVTFFSTKEFLSTFPPQNVTIDIPTTTVLTTTTIVTKKYNNFVSTSYLKPRNCDYDKSSSEEEEEAEKMIGSRGLKKYIDELIAYKIDSKFKNRFNY